MKDPYQEMMEWVVSSTFFLLCFFVAVAFSGCAQTKVDKVMDISIGQKPAISCPKLVMPPVGTDCLLDIQGDKVTANDCGDTLLRGYVRARSLLKPGAVATSSPQ